MKDSRTTQRPVPVTWIGMGPESITPEDLAAIVVIGIPE